MPPVRKIIEGGEQWVPFAMSRLRALSAVGLTYVSQTFTMPDGARVSVSIADDIRSVHITNDAPVILNGIQASILYPGGTYADLPSSTWKIRHRKPMPAEPKAASTYADHPGHITWSSEHFTSEGEPVQLSWRGPPGRYSSHTGWTTGNVRGPIATGTRDLITNVYTDTGSVWINGRHVYSGVQKVIAAALHRPDPDIPDEVVLRVMSDKFPQTSSSRRPVTFDVIPAEATGPVPLGELLAADFFIILNTYPAGAEFTAVDPPFAPTSPEQWSMAQRPHFDSRGERAATVLWRFKLDGQVIGGNLSPAIFAQAASMDPRTWEVLESFTLDGSHSSEYASAGSYQLGPPETGSESIFRTRTDVSTEIVAADFLGDDFTHVHTTHSSASTMTEEWFVTSSSSGGTSGSRTIAETINDVFTVTHSKHGPVLALDATVTRDIANQISSGYGTGSTTISAGGAGRWGPFAQQADFPLCFAGDLSKDVFALGRLTESAMSVIHSGATISPGSTAMPGGTGDYTYREPRMQWDIMVSGEVSVQGTSGSYVVVPNPPITVDYLVGYSHFNVSGGETSSFSSFAPRPCALASPPPGEHLFAAVEKNQLATYFGAHLANDLGGIELVMTRRGKRKAYIPVAVPTYIEGESPTIAAPSFGERRP